MRITSKARKLIGSELHEIGLQFWPTITNPLCRIQDLLESHGVHVDMGNDWHLYAGKGQRKETDLYLYSLGDPDEELTSMLHVQVYRHDTGRYEVTAYLT